VRGFFSSHIIAILAAILFPVFAKAREKARQSSCSSNVKQMVLGMLQYAQDYDEAYPMAGAVFVDPYPWSTWIRKTTGADTWDVAGGAVYPYMKNAQIFMCPSCRTPRYPGCGYEMNANCSRQSLGSLPVPAATALLHESGCDDGAGTNADDVGWTRHNDGLNVGWADGHVKWLKSQNINAAMFSLADD
jgi:prepilin-type processing-associated H-X9-DG protein